MSKDHKYFTSEAVSKMITLWDIAWAFKAAILDYIEKEEVLDEENQKQVEEQDLSFTYYNPYLQPCQSVALNQGWRYRKPFLREPEDELVVLGDFIEKQDLFDAVKIALQEWQMHFHSDRREKKQPVYDVSYKKEMLTAIKIEIDFALFNQRGETSEFRKYLASEQAIEMVCRWEKKQSLVAQPSDSEIITVLCNAREIDWNGAARDHIANSNLIETGTRWIERAYEQATDIERMAYVSRIILDK